MAKNRGSKSDNGTPSRVPAPTEVELNEIDQLQLEKLLLVTETLKAKKENLALRRAALDHEQTELDKLLKENNEARSDFVRSQGLDPSKHVDFRNGKLITKG